jgi:hypothetical protein
MNAVSLRDVTGDRLSVGQGFSWRDPDVGCTLVISHPSAEPGLWSDYAAGAYRSFRKHGVESALDIEALRSGADTIMFFAVVNDDGEVVGGLRAKGPLQFADDSHAVAEWAGQPSQQAVRKMIADRIPYRVLEMKSGWVIDDPGRSRLITNAIARSGIHMLVILDAQFCMATAAMFSLNGWRSSGGVVADIPATPYPDDRYRTRMMWWNRRDFFNFAEPDQVAKILAETKLILHDQYRRGGLAAILPEWGAIANGKPTRTDHSEVA